MCLILFGNINDIRKLNLNLAWKINDDGAGIIVLDTPARIFPGLMNQRVFNQALKRIPKDSHIAVHFRKATHGAVTAKWCHPFNAGHDCWLMHNGIFSSLGEHGANGRSDSAHLATILAYMPLNDKISLLTQIVGYTNRILLTQNNTYQTFGTWHEYGNVKMSNTLLMPTVTYDYNGCNVSTQHYNGKSVFRSGKWESKNPRIDTQQAALPFRQSDLARLFDKEYEEDKAFDAYLKRLHDNLPNGD